MSQSLTFASQVNKLFNNPNLLTVEDVLPLAAPAAPLRADGEALAPDGGGQDS
jgi:hypothetical protein